MQILQKPFLLYCTPAWLPQLSHKLKLRIIFKILLPRQTKLINQKQTKLMAQTALFKVTNYTDVHYLINSES